MLTGVWIHPQSAPKEIFSCARFLDSVSIGQLWIGDEGVSHDPFSLLTGCALSTENLEFGVAVTNPVLRHPAMVAASAATIADISSDRMILGWGTGGEESLGPFGATVESPLQTIEAAIAMARAVLEGRDCEGYAPPSHAVEPSSVRQYIGARGPLLNTLASSIADGVFLSGLSEPDLEDRIRRARSVRSIEVTICQTVRSTGTETPGTMVGSARSIADRLKESVLVHVPTSMCLACIDDASLGRRTDFAVEVLRELGDPLSS